MQLQKARYLGVAVTTSEVVEESAVKRIQNAHMAWTQLRKAKLTAGRMRTVR